MVKLLILADDFTGALDTGVKCADAGISTQVVVASDYNFDLIDGHIDVVVMDLQSRHMPPEDAYKTVYKISKQAKEKGIPHILKKTDSGLRGNIGSELTALYDAYEEPVLPFIPALPVMGRVTVDGVHFSDGVPISQTVFGKDPFSPVKYSSVSDIIKDQSQVPTHVIAKDKFVQDQQGILVFDCETDENILTIAKKLYDHGKLSIMAGCSGIGSVLPQVLGLQGTKNQTFEKTDRFIVICGSVNPITTAQVINAENNGFLHIPISIEEKMDANYWLTDSGKIRANEIYQSTISNPKVVISSFDANDSKVTLEHGEKLGLSPKQIGQRIADSMGQLLKLLIDLNDQSKVTYLVTGGDTLLGFMGAIDKKELDMVTEILPGSVLSKFVYDQKVLQVISKSGGFGQEDLFTKIAEKLR